MVLCVPDKLMVMFVRHAVAGAKVHEKAMLEIRKAQVVLLGLQWADVDAKAAAKKKGKKKVQNNPPPPLPGYPPSIARATAEPLPLSITLVMPLKLQMAA